MQTLVEDFLQFVRHERGQSEYTQKTYASMLNRFVAWAGEQKLADWKAVELSHLIAFLMHERQRPLENRVDVLDPARKLSSDSIYLEIAALRAFYQFAETERYLPTNVA